MINSYGYLYKQIHHVTIGVGLPNRQNNMYYAKPIKLHKGVNNPVQFNIKNNHQKKVNVGGSTFVLNVIEPETGVALLSKTLTVTDGINGILTTDFSKSDMQTFDKNKYHYGIVCTQGDGVEYPVYVDENFDASGTIEVRGDAYPVVPVSTQPTIGVYTDGVALTTTVSIDPENTGLHTVAYTLDNFVGEILAQGYYDDGENTSHWVDIKTSTYASATTGVQTVNFQGIFTGIRFKITKTSGDVTTIQHIV
jgi:hypothetical protein